MKELIFLGIFVLHTGYYVKRAWRHSDIKAFGFALCVDICRTCYLSVYILCMLSKQLPLCTGPRSR